MIPRDGIVNLLDDKKKKTQMKEFYKIHLYIDLYKYQVTSSALWWD